MNKLKYVSHCVFHPFDGFYETKHRGMGSRWIPWAILALYGIVSCIDVQYKGFVINFYHVSNMSSVRTFISSITIFLLFALSNWTVTTLMDGKGKLNDIFLVTTYSLVPVIFCRLIVIFLSNYIIREEAAILYALTAFSWVWFGFMMISGLCTVHEYGLSKNLVTLLITTVAAAIIIFLLVLFISLIEQMLGFFTTFFKEFSRRI